MIDYKKKVLKLYDQRYLTPTFADDSVKRDLLFSGLENILDEVGVPANHGASNSREKLESFIDYEAIRTLGENLGYKNTGMRIETALKSKEIMTYDDFFAQCEAAKSNGHRRGLKGYLHGFKNLGPRSVEVLLKHFEQIGLEIS